VTDCLKDYLLRYILNIKTEQLPPQRDIVSLSPKHIPSQLTIWYAAAQVTLTTSYNQCCI